MTFPAEPLEEVPVQASKKFKNRGARFTGPPSRRALVLLALSLLQRPKSDNRTYQYRDREAAG
jgi:hypothetical protein